MCCTAVRCGGTVPCNRGLQPPIKKVASRSCLSPRLAASQHPASSRQQPASQQPASRPAGASAHCHHRRDDVRDAGLKPVAAPNLLCTVERHAAYLSKAITLGQSMDRSSRNSVRCIFRVYRINFDESRLMMMMNHFSPFITRRCAADYKVERPRCDHSD